MTVNNSTTIHKTNNLLLSQITQYKNTTTFGVEYPDQALGQAQQYDGVTCNAYNWIPTPLPNVVVGFRYRRTQQFIK